MGVPSEVERESIREFLVDWSGETYDESPFERVESALAPGFELVALEDSCWHRETTPTVAGP